MAEEDIVSGSLGGGTISSIQDQEGSPHCTSQAHHKAPQLEDGAEEFGGNLRRSTKH